MKVGQAALSYAARGWRVVPIPRGTKHPPMDEWQHWATTDVELIRQWWTTHPSHGVGIATGVESGIFVLDVDVADGKRGDDTLADLEATYSPLPATMEVITGSGGRHLYFAMPEGVVIVNSAGGRLGPGLDIRGEGGQVLAPPTLHPNGKRYEWEASSLDEVAQAPGWLVALLTSAPAGEARRERTTGTDEDTPGNRYAAAHTWPELLERDGATFLGSRRYHLDGSTYEVWARPGLPANELHVSATLYFRGSDVLKVHSTAWDGLAEGQTYTKFGYYAATRYGGDMKAAAREIRREERYAMDDAIVAAANEIGPDEAASDGLPIPLDWHALYDRSIDDADWLVEDFWPARRAIAVIARYKSGKSLLMFYICCCLARGIDPWTRKRREPITVGYWDYEMTEDDVHERALDFGLEPAELDRFKYYLLPNVPPLDTPEGGKAVLATVRRDGVQATVFDTYGRVVQGEENLADTLNAYNRWTALHLKIEGVASARLDHVGHTEQTRARGSSAKGADVDVAWVLSRGEGNTTRLDHGNISRLRWVPRLLDLELIEGDPDIFRRVGGTWPAGTKELAALLDELGVPIDIGERPAGKALREAGHKRATDAIRSAVKWRRQRSDDALVGLSSNRNTCAGIAPAQYSTDSSGASSGAADGNGHLPAEAQSAAQRGAARSPSGVLPGSLEPAHPRTDPANTIRAEEIF